MISPATLAQAAMPYRRDGETSFDIGRALLIFDARTRITLAEQIAANPGKTVVVGHMGYVPNAEILPPTEIEAG